MSPSAINPQDTLGSGLSVGGLMDDSRNSAEILENIESPNIPCGVLRNEGIKKIKLKTRDALSIRKPAV